MVFALLITSFFAKSVHAHGAVTQPPPRQAIDSNEEPWGGAFPKVVPFEPWCPYPSATAIYSDPGRNLTGANGQARLITYRLHVTTYRNLPWLCFICRHAFGSPTAVPLVVMPVTDLHAAPSHFSKWTGTPSSLYPTILTVGLASL